MTLADYVKRRRAELGLSLSKVADRAQITKTHVWEIENGGSDNPTVTTICGLACALETDAVRLFRISASIGG